MVVTHFNDPLHASEGLERVLENRAVAEQLDEIASLLANQRASEYRLIVNAIRKRTPTE